MSHADNKMEEKIAQKFGPGQWHSLHVLSINATTAEKRRAFKEYIGLTCANFPCGVCRGHCSKYLSSHPIDDYMASALSLFTYTWEFHNVVNKRLGKKIIPFDQARLLYSSPSINVCSADCGK